MNADELQNKLNAYYDLFCEVEDNPSHEHKNELEPLARELETFLQLQAKSGFEPIVKAAAAKIGDLREQEQFEKHRQWLRQFDSQHLRNWEKLLTDHPDGAKCEVFVRELLEANGNEVQPNLDLSGKQQTPDFRCTQGGDVFFVEATVIDTDRVTKFTNLPPRAESGKAYAFGNLNRAIFGECINKTKQCAAAGAPVLLAVGWFHFQASVLCTKQRDAETLLTGTEYITYQLGSDAQRPYISTKLERSAFIKPDKATKEIAPARSPISGVVLCGLGCDPPNFRGVLNPNPTHPFNRKLLPNVPFAKLKDGYEGGSLQTEWI